MRIFNHTYFASGLVALHFLAIVGCKTVTEADESESKFIATKADVKAAYDMLHSVKNLGDCRWTIKPIPSDDAPTTLKMNFEYIQEPKYSLERDFYNDPGSISLVDVKYTTIGLGEPYQVILERVDANTSPANKYRFTFNIEEKKPISLRLEIMNGVRWNVLKDITCKMQES
jgi:hypothetical protein